MNFKLQWEYHRLPGQLWLLPHSFQRVKHKQKWEATFWSCSQVPSLQCSPPAPGCQTLVPAPPCFCRRHMKFKSNWDISPPFTTLNPKSQCRRKMDPCFPAGCSSSKLLLRKGQYCLSPTERGFSKGIRGPSFYTWLWGAKWSNPEQTKAELQLGVRTLQTTGAFSSFTSYTAVTTTLGFKTKSSPSADTFVSVVSG